MTSLFAATFLDPQSIEYYRLSNGQITIPSCYNNSLNNFGKLMIRYIQERIDANNYDGNIINPVLKYVRSGIWIADTTSKYYDGEVKICLNMFNNINIEGTTHICVLVSDEWCYTSDEKLYKFTS